MELYDSPEDLSMLGDLFAQRADWAQASLVYRELLEYCVRERGINHPSSLAAQGDLAIALFELGETLEAVRLEDEAMENAKRYLGPTNPVTSILSWNAVLRHQHTGDDSTARRIIVDDLSWMLIQDQAALNEDQQIIRELLASRLPLASAAVC